MGERYNSKINDSLKNRYEGLYEKFTTASIFFSLSNRLVRILSQMGFGDVTDDDCLPLNLVPYLGTILAHTSSMNIC